MNGSTPVALITGASSGIGEVFARRLSREGYRLILVARRRERLEKLAAELAPAEVIEADLAEYSDLRRVEDMIAAEPQLEFLVNNAGFGVLGSFWETDLEALDKMHRLHIIAIERLTHAALRSMVPRQKGSIINVSSVAGFLHTPNSVCYCATKAWINSFTEGLYLDLKNCASPIRIQALCPGFTYSEFHAAAGIDRNTIPGYLWMTAEDVVDTSLRSLKQNRMVVVPGWKYRLLLILYRWLPQFLKHFALIKYSRRPRIQSPKS
jgi:short-subunit dehydrogenase